MQLPENGADNRPDDPPNMREDFLKKIGPLGAALILILSIVGIVLAFTVDLGASTRYDSRHDEAYYTQNAGTMAELLAELHDEVFPAYGGITNSYVAPSGDRIIIHIGDADLEQQLRFTLRAFDQALFEIIP